MLNTKKSPSFFAVFLALILFGCTPSRQTLVPSSSLSDLSHTLAGKSATIRFTDGSSSKNARDVVLTADSISYTSRNLGVKQRALSEVKEIAYRQGKGGLIGFTVGAVPGIIIILDNEINPHMGNPINSRVARALGRIIGGGLALAGAVVGGLLGSATDEYVVVYQDPGEHE